MGITRTRHGSSHMYTEVFKATTDMYMYMYSNQILARIAPRVPVIIC